jgi:hypothetical protein
VSPWFKGAGGLLGLIINLQESAISEGAGYHPALRSLWLKTKITARAVTFVA